MPLTLVLLIGYLVVAVIVFILVVRLQVETHKLGYTSKLCPSKKFSWVVYFMVSIFWVPSFILVYVDILRGDTE
jgi:hypothetical protein